LMALIEQASVIERILTCDRLVYEKERRRAG
jgi:hypothetical protein